MKKYILFSCFILCFFNSCQEESTLSEIEEESENLHVEEPLIFDLP